MGRFLVLLLCPALWAEPGALRERIKKTLFVPDPLPALDARKHGKFEPAPGVVAERISYGSQFGLRVPAILYRPKKAPGKIPAFIVVNGHGGDKYSWYAYYAGVAYARGGAMVLTYDPPGEGERNIGRKSGTRQHDVYVPPPEMARRMGGLMITDIMQAVSNLAQRPEADARRIAAGGYSMGSFILSLAGAVETRLKACVLVGGGNLDGPGGYWDSSAKRMCQSIPYQSLSFLGDRGAAIYDLHAWRGPTLIFNGTADSVVGIPGMGQPFFEDLRKRTIALHGSAQGVFDFGFEPGGSHRPYFVTRPAAEWLERQIDFPAWTPEQIKNMPVTHIGDWAKANAVSMDRLYATEKREGGTRALGTGVPAIAREALHALPPAEWERDKSRYVLESWISEAKKRVAPE
ncbi:MAG: prolyl oligopeptidase family serine peptidase [Acidobacteria bacterium]|nr:prolyl oligopeptidase family serine peptidase [Acidobacteriota bacterium]